MLAGKTTPLSSFGPIVHPPLAFTPQPSNPPSGLRYDSSLPSRAFCRRQNSSSSYLITRATEHIAETFWEEPNGRIKNEGDESEIDDIMEEPTEMVYVGVSNAWHSNSDFEQLVEEVEQLLEPEENDIFKRNEVADISKISTRKWSLFHSLGMSLQIPLMDELLERGWDIDSVDKDGYTALHKAVLGKKEAVISHLLRKGANPHARDSNGATVLHHAVKIGAIQTVKLLIKCKVDVNASDNEGWTPLHICMQSRSMDIAKVLLVNDADPTRRNKDGKTPLDLSICYGRDFKSRELAKLLKFIHANRSIRKNT